MARRLQLTFKNAILDNKEYREHIVMVDDDLTIDVIEDFTSINVRYDEDGCKRLPINATNLLVESLRDRYFIPDEFEKVNFDFMKRLSM